jgi:50S ribosomal subunit-associated GTPase HflX
LIRDPDSAAWLVPEESIHECRGADLVVHVIDASHPEATRRAREVAAALERAGIRAMMSVWTQADRFPAGFGAAAPWFVSGRTRWGCDHLLASLHRAAMRRGTRDGPVRTDVELARAALV